ncbi:hypothetical protein Tamer19_69980 [Cupriavidus sp. TA19]|uniref:TIGR00366 family protein n=1 Tax=Cupriavidus sp. TA19 TaxID=701108 RepID=UPI0027294D62|nr:TIGR00366 family protein [Cupriavidus sp. TA19]GLC97589.1 hypothetical protein Tamer19_69980 [Cupriavidus sp. TA19]
MHASTSENLEVSGSPSRLQKVANRFTLWAERWFPDAYIFALIALLAACAAALGIGASAQDVIVAIGDGYWNLIRFTYQMAMVLIGGYALAASKVAKRGIDAVGSFAKTGEGAIVLIAFVSIAGSLLNWGFGMIMGGLLVLALARRHDLRMDFRAAAAAAMVGSATIPMLGLSSGPALLQANAASMPPELLKAGGVIPMTESILVWQNAVTIVIVTVAALLVAYFTAPRGGQIKTARDLNIALAGFGGEKRVEAAIQAKRPGDWLSDSPLMAWLVACLSIAWIAHRIYTHGFVATISDLNNYIFICITLAIILHGRIRAFLEAVYSAVPAVGPMLIQFPIYAATSAVIVTVKNSHGASVASYLGELFINLGGGHALPLVIGVYSIIMGLFIPAAGARWVLEAPYVFHAAQAVKLNLGWTLVTFNGAEALTNFINPFWMLPLLGMLGLAPRNVVGYTFLYFIFVTPVMLVTLWAFSFTLPFHSPVFP